MGRINHALGELEGRRGGGTHDGGSRENSQKSSDGKCAVDVGQEAPVGGKHPARIDLD